MTLQLALNISSFSLGTASLAQSWIYRFNQNRFSYFELFSKYFSRYTFFPLAFHLFHYTYGLRAFTRVITKVVVSFVDLQYGESINSFFYIQKENEFIFAFSFKIAQIKFFILLQNLVFLLLSLLENCTEHFNNLIQSLAVFGRNLHIQHKYNIVAD